MPPPKLETMQVIDDPATGSVDESERRTRLRRVDPRLERAGWTVVDFDPTRPIASSSAHAIREYPTDNGPADYALVAVIDIRVSIRPATGVSRARRMAK